MKIKRRHAVIIDTIGEIREFKQFAWLPKIVGEYIIWLRPYYQPKKYKMGYGLFSSKPIYRWYNQDDDYYGLQCRKLYTKDPK